MVSDCKKKPKHPICQNKELELRPSIKKLLLDGVNHLVLQQQDTILFFNLEIQFNSD